MTSSNLQGRMSKTKGGNMMPKPKLGSQEQLYYGNLIHNVMYSPSCDTNS